MNKSLVFLLLLTFFIGIFIVYGDSIVYVDPTPVNNTISNESNFISNISIHSEALGNISYTFNSNLNYFFYNYLLFGYSFNNNSALFDTVNTTSGLNNKRGLKPSYGTIVYVDGVSGMAINFSSYNLTGSSVQNASYPAYGHINFTLTYWVKYKDIRGYITDINRVGATGHNRIVFGHAGSSAIQYLQVYNGSAFLSYNEVANGSFTISSGVWYHVAYTYNTNDKLLHGYINGNEQGSPKYVNISWVGLVNIGGDLSTSWSNASLDEYYLFNKTLTQSEVNFTYHYFLHKVNDTDYSFIVNNTKLIPNINNVYTTSLYNQSDLIDSMTYYYYYDVPGYDNNYPYFYNYWSDSNPIYYTGYGHFNVTVDNTNGTVYLNIGGGKYQAQNLSGNVYNASYYFVSLYPGYTYNWSAYGNGSANNFNESMAFDYEVTNLIWMDRFYQNPLNVSVNQTITVFCRPNSSMAAPQNLTTQIYYKQTNSSVYTAAPTYWMGRPLIYTLGDSITAGHNYYDPNPGVYNGTDPVNNSYEYWLDYHLNSNISVILSTNYSAYNKGVGSDTCNNMQTRINTQVGNNSIVILLCGINDFAKKNTTEDVIGYVMNIYNSAMAKNDSLVVMEVLPDGAGLFCSNITPYNNWLNNNFSLLPNVTVVQMHQYLTNGTYCHINSSYFEADNIHPNRLGYQRIGQVLWETAFSNLSFNSYYANISASSLPTNYYDFMCNSSDGTNNITGINESTVYVYNPGYTDTIYPYFYNYWDNSYSLNMSGIAIFNVSVENTNGSVFIFIDAIKYEANHVSGFTYNYSRNLTGGTYSYFWGAYGNGTLNNYNVSPTFSYSVNISGSPPTFASCSSAACGAVSFILFFVLLMLDLALFIIPFVKTFDFRIYGELYNEIINYLMKRAFWIIAGLLFYYIFLMMRTISKAQGLGLDDELLGLNNILVIGLFMLIGWLAFAMIFVPIKMAQAYKNAIRNGNNPGGEN